MTSDERSALAWGVILIVAAGVIWWRMQSRREIPTIRGLPVTKLVPPLFAAAGLAVIIADVAAAYS